jgi:hypothetical protein
VEFDTLECLLRQILRILERPAVYFLPSVLGKRVMYAGKSKDRLTVWSA